MDYNELWVAYEALITRHGELKESNTRLLAALKGLLTVTNGAGYHGVAWAEARAEARAAIKEAGDAP